MRQTRSHALIGENYQILPFAELPLPYQMAMVWYMAIDGEAWDCPELFDLPEITKADVEKRMPHFIEHYGTRPFGVVTLSSETLKSAVMDDEEIASSFSSWEDYHEWYTSHSDMPAHGHENRWPVILWNGNTETLQDGWHRFHSYIRDGHSDIPVIFYPERQHLEKMVRDHHAQG